MGRDGSAGGGVDTADGIARRSGGHDAREARGDGLAEADGPRGRTASRYARSVTAGDRDARILGGERGADIRLQGCAGPWAKWTRWGVMPARVVPTVSVPANEEQ